MPKAKRWSFTSPALHLLTVSLKMAGQEVGGKLEKEEVDSQKMGMWSFFFKNKSTGINGGFVESLFRKETS